ncbi:MAG TPA: VTT domain-containing protein [Anaerolineales bacterium]|nr:VTT domain-containing protein [Anaerolineales bacterium]
MTTATGHTRALRILTILLVVALSLAIFAIPRERLEQLQALGYVGIFLICLLSYATVILPVPAGILVFSMATQLPPVGLALAAGTGAALGELSGYLAGYSGQAIAEKSKAYQRVTDWVQRNAPLTILLLSFVPNPFFDLTGIAAGATRLPLRIFLGWCWVGETLKMLVIAFAGAGLLAIPWIKDIFVR